MKVILINPALCNFRDSSAHAMPLGLMYLAAVIEQQGHTAKVLDADNLRLSWEDMEKKLSTERPDVIGITATSLSMVALKKTAEVAKKILPKSRIIAGGFGPTLEPHRTLKENPVIELVCLGESERTIVDLLKCWQDKLPLDQIKGIIYRDGDKLIETAKREPIMDLDTLPFPAYHLLEPPQEKYIGIHTEVEGIKRPILVMFASRGCPHRCIFCSLGSKVVRFRKPQKVVDEIEKYVKTYRAQAIQLYDDEFIGMSPQENIWVSEICDEIIKRKLDHIGYMVQGRCSRFIEPDVLKKMRRVGFRWIWWGVESGSQQVLDSIKKDIKVENIKRAFALAKQADLKSLMFIMTGFPEETEKNIKETADLISEVKPDTVRIHIATPLPGSELKRILESGNMIEDYNVLNYVMRGKAVHHTKYFSSKEIVRNYEMLKFRFEEGHKRFVRIFFKSFLTVSGLKKLPVRAYKIFTYSMRWLKWKILKFS
ncbi:radical SAM protein [Candidatus Parcubacteria bacterium]|nr:MAG: radical SAM protein [Candidatus Parcubacteria bacterium]